MIQNGVASHHLSYARESFLLCILGYIIKFNEVKPDLHAVLFLLKSKVQISSMPLRIQTPTTKQRQNE